MKNLLVIIILLLPINTIGQSDSLEFRKGDWGIGFDFGPCTGFGSIYGDAKNYISPECHVNIGLIFIKDKIHYNARLSVMTGELKKDLEFDNNWNKESSFQSTNLDLALGYHLIDSRRFNVIPFLSVGSKYFNSFEKDLDQSNSVGGFFSYGASLAVDYKIHFAVKEKNRYPGSDFTQQYLYIRVLGGVYPNHYSNVLNLYGSLTFINFTIGGNFIPEKKVTNSNVL